MKDKQICHKIQHSNSSIQTVIIHRNIESTVHECNSTWKQTHLIGTNETSEILWRAQNFKLQLNISSSSLLWNFYITKA